jgi:hypothetical protein
LKNPTPRSILIERQIANICHDMLVEFNSWHAGTPFISETLQPRLITSSDAWGASSMNWLPPIRCQSLKSSQRYRKQNEMSDSPRCAVQYSGQKTVWPTIVFMKIFSTALCTCSLILAAQLVNAQDRLHYREFQLGSDVASIAKLIGTASSDIKLVHQRPAVMQDLEWRPRYFSRSASAQTDPVDLILLRFVDDQLFRVVVDYARDRTAGMTEADMIEAIAAIYGPASKVLATSSRVPTLEYGGVDAPVAIWADEEASITLFRVAYPVSFRLVIALTRLDNLARTASAEAVRLDAREAPQREIARRKKEDEEALVALRKAKIENKAVFTP